MKLAADLHIHSSLSPCGDEDMTPNNIVEMAALKRLDIIAITDHNSAENLEAAVVCGCRRNILVVPGMEVETAEEVHLLCYFPTVTAALDMQKAVYASLPDIRNREDIFGRQLILDGEDNVKGILERLLLTASCMGLEEVSSLVRGLGGVPVPAHVDRDSYSILSNLGFIPDSINFNYLELSKECSPAVFTAMHPEYTGRRFLRSSDAHHLGDILERESLLDMEESSLDCFFKLLGK